MYSLQTYLGCAIKKLTRRGTLRFDVSLHSLQPDLGWKGISIPSQTRGTKGVSLPYND